MEGTEQLEDVGYLQDIINYIFDEKKIVTYKWISNIFAIHVNRAKQLLYTFIKHISKEKLKDLKIIYFVGGILPDHKGCHLQLVSEEDKEKVKAQFEVTTSEHIYSVCLKNCLSDLHNLCSIDGVKESKVTRNGAVRYTKGVPRASEEVVLKRQGTFKAVDEDKKWPAEQQRQPSAGNNGKKSSKSAGSISSMFSAQKNKEKMEDAQRNKEKEEDSVKTKKAEEERKQKNTTSPEKKIPTSKNAPKGGKPPAGRLAAMFSAQNAKPKPVKKDNQEERKCSTGKDTSEKATQLLKDDLKSEEKESKSTEKKHSKSIEKEEQKSGKKDNKVVPEKGSKRSKSESKKSKQKKRKASDNRVDKNQKRKRIIVMDESDSSSDDILGSDEEETPPSPDPVIDDEEMEEPTQVDSSKETESLPAESQTKDHYGRKRRLVDKTYMDEEGYVVTKKVYEFVSCSRSENEDEKENEKSVESLVNKKEEEPTPKPKAVKAAQKPEKNNTQKKASPPEKKKQATLMNFFKRN